MEERGEKGGGAFEGMCGLVEALGRMLENRVLLRANTPSRKDGCNLSSSGNCLSAVLGSEVPAMTGGKRWKSKRWHRKFSRRTAAECVVGADAQGIRNGEKRRQTFLRWVWALNAHRWSDVAMGCKSGD